MANKEKCYKMIEQVEELLSDAGLDDILVGNRDTSKEINLLTVAINELKKVVVELIESDT